MEKKPSLAPVLHLGYAFHASSCKTRASAGAKVVSQEGALLPTENKLRENGVIEEVFEL